MLVCCIIALFLRFPNFCPVCWKKGKRAARNSRLPQELLPERELLQAGAFRAGRMRQTRTRAVAVGGFFEAWLGAIVGGPARGAFRRVAHLCTTGVGSGLTAFTGACGGAGPATQTAGRIAAQQGKRKKQSRAYREAASPEEKAGVGWARRSAHEGFCAWLQPKTDGAGG